MLTRDEFLTQAAFVGEEVKRQYWSVLDGFTDGLLFYYFGNLDQVSHMMWRARDPGSPRLRCRRATPRYASVIDDLYVAFDRIVGETLRRIGPDTTLIVMSDHGFTSWRRSFHLNSWLRDHGYLAVVDPTRSRRSRPLSERRLVAHAGLRPRPERAVHQSSRPRAVGDRGRRTIARSLSTRFGEGCSTRSIRRRARAAVTKAYLREQIYTDAGHFDIAPDLIVGYAEGTRVSNESALGGLPAGVIVDNTGEWSGDHCMDPEAVPGILLTNRPLRQPARSLDKVAGAILAEFGISGFPTAR